MSPLEQVLGLVPPGTSPKVPVRVTRWLPYESTNPEKPGPVHAILFCGLLLVSREAFAEIQRESDRTRSKEDLVVT